MNEFKANLGPGKSWSAPQVSNRELSFIDLISAMRAGSPVVCRGLDGGIFKGKACIINGIAREDGSGRSWIITVALIGDNAPDVGMYWHESKPCPFVQG